MEFFCRKRMLSLHNGTDLQRIMTNERHACRKRSCWKLSYAAEEEPISQKPTCAFKRLIAKLRPRRRIDPVLEHLTQDAEDSGTREQFSGDMNPEADNLTESLSGPVTEFDAFRDTEALTILERSQLQSILSVPGRSNGRCNGAGRSERRRNSAGLDRASDY